MKRDWIEVETTRSGRHQEWINETQRIVSDFVQNDDELGMLLLDHGVHHWDSCFDNGLTPQQALDLAVELLQSNDTLKNFKQFLARGKKQ